MTGSEKPDLVEGKPYLFSMKFCPFAHRARLALSYKQIPHEIININLKNKPKWYLDIHPEGKVPAFIGPDGKVVVESDVIVNTLDEMYPDPPLYNEETKSRDLELVKNFGKIINIFSDCIHGRDSRPLDEVVAEISKHLEQFEEELETRGTDFFGGDTPGIVDIMIWPWVERSKALPLIYKQPLSFEKEKFPLIIKWVMNMKAQDFVIENAGPIEKFAKLILSMKEGNVDFDSI
ncbi:pyrimidodiazepine synthase-like isoform X2 [Belonocnema kinseyi]|uniref:pyrimidodiazepine synthase-like isoform X2 n=1 Tax=Belonocnema kinseyi TaxID=2817044 RepID=UPI00143DDDD2|nr:pyrimidodiazepine synthase-like isoform X2 [Belonocnema kinseyi]